ncbi:MAG: hypothetical protein ACRDUX_02695 [Mycobacterium sp.]
MSTEAMDTAKGEPDRFTTVWCRIETCDNPVDGNFGGPYCVAHRRTFKFSATLNDALNEFLSGIGGFMQPSAANTDDVREAGELFALGLSKMFGTAFGMSVLVDPTPITTKTDSGKSKGRLRWHVSFRWQEFDDEPDGYAAMDETDESDDEYNNGDDGDDDE